MTSAIHAAASVPGAVSFYHFYVTQGRLANGEPCASVYYPGPAPDPRERSVEWQAPIRAMAEWIAENHDVALSSIWREGGPLTTEKSASTYARYLDEYLASL